MLTQPMTTATGERPEGEVRPVTSMRFAASADPQTRLFWG
jgi:hypothetical protein